MDRASIVYSSPVAGSGPQWAPRPQSHHCYDVSDDSASPLFVFEFISLFADCFKGFTLFNILHSIHYLTLFALLEPIPGLFPSLIFVSSPL